MARRMTRAEHADLYGPTTGDLVRLADTDLFAEVEDDLTARGDEVVFGGGKVIREGMGMNGRLTRDEGVLDTVITNALILDHTGVYKADVGMKKRKSHENPGIQRLYKEYLGEPNSHKAHHRLHTHYTKRSKYRQAEAASV